MSPSPGATKVANPEPVTAGRFGCLVFMDPRFARFARAPGRRGYYYFIDL